MTAPVRGQLTSLERSGCAGLTSVRVVHAVERPPRGGTEDHAGRRRRGEFTVRGRRDP